MTGLLFNSPWSQSCRIHNCKSPSMIQITYVIRELRKFRKLNLKGKYRIIKSLNFRVGVYFPQKCGSLKEIQIKKISLIKTLSGNIILKGRDCSLIHHGGQNLENWWICDVFLTNALAPNNNNNNHNHNNHHHHHQYPNGSICLHLACMDPLEISYFDLQLL